MKKKTFCIMSILSILIIVWSMKGKLKKIGPSDRVRLFYLLRNITKVSTKYPPLYFFKHVLVISTTPIVVSTSWLPTNDSKP